MTGRLGSVQLTTAAHFQEKLNRNTSGAAFSILLLAAENRETGENPVRTRHCDRGVFLRPAQKEQPLGDREGGRWIWTGSDPLKGLIRFTIGTAGNMLIRKSGDLPDYVWIPASTTSHWPGCFFHAKNIAEAIPPDLSVSGS